MTSLKGIALAACIGALLPAASVTVHAADDSMKVAAADTKGNDADMRAKAADCSRQADEKKLHGAERKKFREACKRK